VSIQLWLLKRDQPFSIDVKMGVNEEVFIGHLVGLAGVSINAIGGDCWHHGSIVG